MGAGSPPFGGVLASAYRFDGNSWVVSDDSRAPLSGIWVIASGQSVAVAAGATTQGSNANLGMNGSIGGKITDARGAVLSGIYVIAYRSNSGELLFAGLTLSDASGQYVLSELPAATYRISFHDPTSTHISEWYMDAADLAQAQDVSLVADEVAHAIDATLEPAVDDRKQRQDLYLRTILGVLR